MTGTGGIGSGVPTTPDARALLLQLSSSNARALTAGLQPGEMLTARVGQSFADGSVMLEVGGKSLIASSAVPLTPDALVRLQVQIAGNQPVLKLLDGGPVDEIHTSTAAVRAAVLGLPATSTAALVLKAFETVGAPLNAERLQAAMTAVGNLPPEEANLRAQAMGLLAKINAPITPPMLALAERSLLGEKNASVPNVAAAVQHVQQAVQGLLTNNRLPLNPSNSGTLPTPVVTTASPPTSAPGAPVLGVPMGVVLANTTAPGSAAIPVPVSIALPTTVPSALPVVPGQAGTSAPTIAGQSLAATSILPQASLGPSAGPTVGPTVGQASKSPITSAVTPGAAPLASTPISPVATSLLQPGLTTGLPATTSTVTTPQLSSSIVGSVSRQPLIVGQLPALSAQHIAAALAQSTPPDGGRDGARAVMQALGLVGIRPRESTVASHTPREPTALQALAQAVTSSPPLPISSSDPRAPIIPQSVDQAMTVLVRESLVETIFKPQALSDYDKVLAVPMHVQQHPTPMRFAIAERETAAGTATFVRVDTELTNLGPLSVRLSGIDGGALSITIFAHGPAQANLQALCLHYQTVYGN